MRLAVKLIDTDRRWLTCLFVRYACMRENQIEGSYPPQLARGAILTGLSIFVNLEVVIVGSNSLTPVVRDMHNNIIE